MRAAAASAASLLAGPGRRAQLVGKPGAARGAPRPAPAAMRRYWRVTTPQAIRLPEAPAGSVR
jgi:hypothetical protein